jgi:hypothetical protein
LASYSSFGFIDRVSPLNNSPDSVAARAHAVTTFFGARDCPSPAVEEPGQVGTMTFRFR